MLRGTKFIYKPSLFVLIGAFSLSPNAMAGEIGPDTAAGAQKLSSAKLTCNPMDQAYTRTTPTGQVPDPSKLQVCTSCKQAVDQQKQSVEQARNAAIQKNNAVVGAGSAGSAATGAAANGLQKDSQGSANTNTNVGQAAQSERAALAKALGQSASTCSSQIQSACSGNLATEDQKAVESAHQGCQDIASGSAANSAEKAASSGGMGDLSQLASALGSALGAMQGAGGGAATPAPDSSSITPDSAVSTVSTVDGSSLGTTPSQSASVGIDPLKTAGTSIGGANAGITGTTPFAASTYASSGLPDAASSYGASDTGNSGGSSPYIASPSSSGSGSGSTNSSGASMMGKDDAAKKAAAAAAAAGENYEVPSGGGGGSKASFLGLKSHSPDEEPLAGADAGSMLGGLGLEEGARDLASVQANADIRAEDEGNLFHAVHTKIAEIKKRGSI